ncbi:unnamed protein product [Toxocara canis]|uniref:Uncharacterized protein n=1 Tax=Toxocara canis TaxID=6265 RepID=A0A3P7H7I2_TOXCA|nr:unnamed protein product [Toxocara canis]
MLSNGVVQDANGLRGEKPFDGRPQTSSSPVIEYQYQHSLLRECDIFVLLVYLSVVSAEPLWAGKSSSILLPVCIRHDNLQKMVVCHNEINNLRGEMSALDEDLRKIKFLDIAVEDMKNCAPERKSIRAEASKLNTKLIEYQLRRHRLEANGVLRSFE